MAVKKVDVKATSVAQASKTTETKITDKVAEQAPKKATASKATTAKPIAKTTEKSAAKTTTVKPVAKTTTTKPTEKTATTKATAKKTATKVATTGGTLSSKTQFHIQFAGKDISTSDILQKVQDIWTKELGNKLSAVKSLEIYMKPEEHLAYYVVNEEVSGKVDM